MNKKENLFYEYPRKNKFLIVTSIAFTVGIAFVAPLKSFIIQWLIDAPTKSVALKYLIFGAFITVASFTLELISRNLFTKIKCGAISLIRTRIMDATLNISMKDYFKEGNSHILSVLTNDIKILEDDLYDGIYNVALYGGMLFFAICMLIYISPSLLIFILSASVLPFVVPRILDRGIRTARQNYSEQLALYTNQALDILKGFEMIRQFNVTGLYSANHTDYADKTAAVEKNFQEKMNLSISVSSFLSNFLFYVILLVGMFLFFEGKVTIGYMVAATNLSNFIIAPCKVISQQFSRIKSSKAIQEKLQAIVDVKVDFVGEEMGDVDRIEWKNVYFQYGEDTQWGLADVNLQWKKNDKIAIFGKSGSGKSTLIKLFCKYFDDYKGEIKINQTELRKISYESFFSKVTLLSQNPYLFNDTIRNNICLYEKFSEEEIEKALSMSGINQYIKELPKGLETMILENGKNLSGGQSQRIALARALIRNRGMIVIDEGTSGVDTETAEEIMNSLVNNPELTVVLITHDIGSTYFSAIDKKYSVENGSVKLMN